MDPLWLALAAFVIVIVCVLWLRLPAFLALIFASLLIAMGTPTSRLRDAEIRSLGNRIEEVGQNTFESADARLGDSRVFREVDDAFQEVGRGIAESFENGIRLDKVEAPIQPGDFLVHETQMAQVDGAATSAGSRVALGFGNTCRSIGLLIAMASVIGCCLLETGAARRVVDVTRDRFGEKRTPLAFAVSGFVVGIPVFFDTVFYLLMPLAKAMRAKTGGNYLLYVLSIVVGGSMAHSLVPPTPGPLLVASRIDGVEIVDMMIGGLIVGFFAVASGYLYAVWANRRWEIPLRDDTEAILSKSDASDNEASDNEASDNPLDNPLDRVEAPSFGLSLLPIVLPVVLLAFGTITKHWQVSEDVWRRNAADWTQFFGDKNIALTLSAIVALVMLIFHKRKVGDKDWPKALQASLTSGGMILLITAAGGAFGHVLRQSGVAEAIQDRFPATRNDLMILCVAFLVTVLVRFVQGSATVAMVTSVGIVAPLASQIELGFHPVYLALAIGCGSKPLPWMNDSGFWIVGKMSGMTEAETLKTFSVTLTIMGVVGFLVTLAGATWLPLSNP